MGREGWRVVVNPGYAGRPAPLPAQQPLGGRPRCGCLLANLFPCFLLPAFDPIAEAGVASEGVRLC
jgi:hypothetical protein